MSEEAEEEGRAKIFLSFFDAREVFVVRGCRVSCVVVVVVVVVVETTFTFTC